MTNNAQPQPFPQNVPAMPKYAPQQPVQYIAPAPATQYVPQPQVFVQPMAPQQLPPVGPKYITTRQGANHSFHLILTFMSCGAWAFTGWPIAALIGKRTKTRVR